MEDTNIQIHKYTDTNTQMHNRSYTESSSAANYNGPGVEWKMPGNEEGAAGLVALVWYGWLSYNIVCPIILWCGMVCYHIILYG